MALFSAFGHGSPVYMPNPSQSFDSLEVQAKLLSNFHGNQIFNESFCVDKPPTLSNHTSTNNDTYEQFKSYHSRLRLKSSPSPELNRRYFSDLDDDVAVSTLSVESSRRTSYFTNHLAKRASQLDRLDMNIVSGKSSLFITNHENEDADFVYGRAFKTNTGSKLLLPFSPDTFLGEGRYSKVYKGSLQIKGESSWREVAVKLAFRDPESIESMNHELQALNAIDSPSVVKVIDLVAFNNSTTFEKGYLMELAEFGTLESFVVAKDVFSLSLHQFLSWSNQILTAVKALSLCGWTHFDIKPQNILVMKDYSLKLGDFGESMNNIYPDFDDTRGRGTLHYTAPELLSLDRQGQCNGAAVDMYSAGLIVYSLFTGRLPWQDVQGPATHQILAIRKGFFTGSQNPLPVIDGSSGFKLPGPNGEIIDLVIAKEIISLIQSSVCLKESDRVSVSQALTALEAISCKL